MPLEFAVAFDPLLEVTAVQLLTFYGILLLNATTAPGRHWRGAAQRQSLSNKMTIWYDAATNISEIPPWR